MRAFRELAGGIFIALLTIGTVIGGILLAVSESGEPVAQATPAPATTAPAVPTSLPTLAPTFPPTLTPAPTLAPTDTPPPATEVPLTLTPTEAAPTPAPSLSPTATLCAPPSAWVPYVIRRGDTLFQLSLRFAVSTQALQAGNCLPNTDIKFGQVLYVPFVPTPTSPSPTPTVLPTDTPVPEPLAILNISLANVRRDDSRPNGAIAFVHVSVTGGAAPYTLYDEGLLQPDNPMPILAECSAPLIHTARVDSADGQSVGETYYFDILCP